jgi:hypothetical protein
MGYSIEFFGEFKLDRPLDAKTAALLRGLSTTRRYKRNLGEEYGIEGEFYVGKDGCGEVDYNKPPSTQPSLWCQWEYVEKRQSIRWDGEEKFDCYLEWLQYLIDRVLNKYTGPTNDLDLKPYVLNGTVKWHGDEFGDSGSIIVKDNVITVKKNRKEGKKKSGVKNEKVKR